MRLAALIGISIGDFWDMTPAELYIYAEAYGDRRRAENVERQQLDALQAYLISQWVWQKRINIKKILADIASGAKQKEEMTDEQMLRRVKALNAMFGGTEERG